MTKAVRPVPKPTMLGVAPPAPGSKVPPERPDGRYRVAVSEVVELGALKSPGRYRIRRGRP